MPFNFNIPDKLNLVNLSSIMKRFRTYNFLTAGHPTPVTVVICVHAEQSHNLYRSFRHFLSLKDFITISPACTN